MDLAEAVRELYALEPGGFIGGRDRLAKAAKADGDAALAATIKKLKKPSAGAWLANMLALHRQPDLLPVLELGRALREAQDELDGDELRRLGRERADVLKAALTTARELAAQLGQPAGDAPAADLEQTLRAALNDDEAAAAVASGQLVRGITATGLGPVDLDGALADPASVPAVPELRNHRLRRVPEPAAESSSSPAPDGEPDEQAATRRAGEEKARREQERAEAEARVTETRTAADAADEELAEARAEVTRTAAEYERLTTRLAKLREQVVSLDTRAKQTRKTHRAAQKSLRDL